ncbi:membrane-bound lytic murein transglycosylase MltF [Motiliproteus sp. MSK22-1]|uniref:membrane-bound lytic murein transglycosylase MltF n=1 Tax=Motiliproteus sp. MSK22-1 TaxID=1897630 RepID=UPI00097688BF|nr:membrane-bound lytic murein transglycosylase MltF [Motiliproteus sp. MSK22-1]OMH31839.1 hypothetical protein BGP75_17170 [Motiliproteus sp. MSK22-1]
MRQNSFFKNPFKSKDSLLLLVVIVIFCVPILASYNPATQLDVIKRQGELRIITRLSPTTYFVSNGEHDGFEYELAKLYANYLGVKLKISTASDIQEIYEALRLNNAHIATAGLTQTAERQQRFDFSPPYHTGQTQLVYLKKKKNKAPKTYQDLKGGSLMVMSNSSHSELLRSLDPGIESWQESSELEVLDLMEAVHDGKLDYTLVDSSDFAANSFFFPRLGIAFSFANPQPIAWMLKKRSDGSLKRSLDKFFSIPHTKNEIKRLQNKYFQSGQRLNLVDNLTFRKHLRERLPALKDWFQEAAQQTGIDWQMLAAIGYQESHWNPKAVSPTGVRGIMMLTRDTAKEVGVKKRTDPQQSIMGGARYFSQQKSRLPKRIQEPDRTWLALATYNVGRGHLEDARILTQRAGMNPDRWDDVAKHLPLLSQARWYKTVKHGYARGREPVTYVRNIRRYIKQLKLETRIQAVQAAQAIQQAESEAASEAPTQAPETLPETL